jgi:hypothetical protein
MNLTFTSMAVTAHRNELLAAAAGHRSRRLARETRLRADGSRTCFPHLLRSLLSRPARSLTAP